MFAGQTDVLPYIRNYAEAHAHFTKTPKPPRSRKWADYQRPLKDSRSTHYRIETDIRNPGEYYDLVLYQTTMARFHKPDAFGVERRDYRGHFSTTSRGFMRDVLGVHTFMERRDTNGNTVIAPVYDYTMPGSTFSAEFYFDCNGNLITEMSKHTRHYKKVSNGDDKENRVHARKLFEPLLTLAAMRLPHYGEYADVNGHLGEPFGQSQVSWKHREHVKKICAALQVDGTPAPESIDIFFDLGQCVFNKLASTRAYKEGLLRGWNTFEYDELPEKLWINEKDFTTSLWRAVYELLGLQARSGRVEYPQFPAPDVLVRSNVVL